MAKCKGIKTDKEKCTFNALEDSDYCGHHQSQANNSRKSCRGVKQDGTTCSFNALEDSDYCGHHQSQANNSRKSCRGVKQDGTTCSFNALEDSDYCGHHQSKGSKKVEKKCLGMKKDGTKCSFTALEDSDYCGHHQAKSKQELPELIIESDDEVDYCCAVVASGPRSGKPCQNYAFNGGYCRKHTEIDPEQEAARQNTTHCLAVRKDGSPCENKPKQDQKYCGVHEKHKQSPKKKYTCQVCGTAGVRTSTHCEHCDEHHSINQACEWSSVLKKSTDIAKELTCSTSTCSMPCRKALIVGLTYKGTSDGLNGPLNDAKNIARILMDKFGWKQDQLLILTDGPKSNIEPTRQAILNGFDWLVKDQFKDGHFFFYFSGHACRTGLEASDAKVTSEEIKAKLTDRIPEKGQLVSILDCCHSSFVIKYPFAYTGNHEKLKRYPDRQDMKNPNLVVISGCRGDQESIDYSDDETIKAHGILTRSIVDVIKTFKGHLSWAQLMYPVKQILTRTENDQTPQFQFTRPSILQEKVQF